MKSKITFFKQWRYAVVLMLLLSVGKASAQCNGYIELNTQQQVDNFAAMYPDCTTFYSINIDGYDITDLSPLNSIQSTVSLNIRNTNIQTINLTSLSSVPSFVNITSNPLLTSLSGLENLTNTGTLQIANNPSLISIEGIKNVNNISYLIIFGNTNLSVCNQPNVCSLLATGIPRVIQSNSINCNNDLEILATCTSNTPTTQLLPGYCGLHLTSTSQEIHAMYLPGAQMYRFRVGQNFIDTPFFYFTFNAFPQQLYQPGMPYSVDVAVMVNGQWGSYGSACTVFAPEASAPVQVMSSFCGTQIASSATPVYCNPIPGAAYYSFSVYFAQNTFYQVNTPNNYFTFNDIPAGMVMPGQTVTIEVSAFANSQYYPPGATCAMTAPGAEGCTAPVALNQTVCQPATVANLTATGINLKWYSAATGGTPLANTKKLVTGTYYVSSANGACESQRVPFAVTVIYCGTKVAANQCSTTVDFSTQIFADELSGVSQYRFRVTNGANVQTIDRTERYFRLKDLASYAYSTAYIVDVAVFAAGAWSIYGPACTISTSALPTTKIIASQCGSTFSSFGTSIYADDVAAATRYKFRITDGVTTQLIEKPTRVFTITNIAGHTFGKTYTVDVAVRINGSFGNYGSTCTISTIGAITQLSTGYCDSTLSSFGTALYADAVAQASTYRFKVSDGVSTQIIEKSTRVFTISNFTGYTYGKTYTVEVAANINGSYTTYGSSCTVTTMPQPLTQLSAGYCGVTVPSSGSALYANEVALATGYRFRVTANGNTHIIDRPTRVFSLSRIPGFAYGVTYSIEVTAIVNGVAGEYGPACTAKAQAFLPRFSEENAMDMTSIEIIEETTPLAQVVTFTAYPNPYTDVFSIEINTQSQDKVTVRAFDMTGKLVDDITVSPDVLASQKLGSRYAAGIYNVIVMQGDYSKAFKVVKR